MFCSNLRPKKKRRHFSSRTFYRHFSRQNAEWSADDLIWILAKTSTFVKRAFGSCDNEVWLGFWHLFLQILWEVLTLPIPTPTTESRNPCWLAFPPNLMPLWKWSEHFIFQRPRVGKPRKVSLERTVSFALHLVCLIGFSQSC